MIETGIVALLLATPAVTTLVAKRIYPVVLPPELDVAKVGACLTYQDITAEPEFTLDRKKSTDKRIQFDAFSSSYISAKTVLIAVASVLDGFTGSLSDGTRVILAFQSTEIDKFEDKSRVYRCYCEYEVQYSTN